MQTKEQIVGVAWDTKVIFVMSEHPKKKKHLNAVQRRKEEL